MIGSRNTLLLRFCRMRKIKRRTQRRKRTKRKGKVLDCLTIRNVAIVVTSKDAQWVRLFFSLSLSLVFLLLPYLFGRFSSMQSFIRQFQFHRSDTEIWKRIPIPLFSESRTEHISTSRHKTLTLLSCGVTWWAAFWRHQCSC